ncbi:MAG: hypothetical protein HYU52_02375 [Acidobacteria bacterium]|nr:hypothetical protein [Acidobacteriota bacterium]
MTMKLPQGLTPQELRVLQEFRRVAQEELTEAEICGIKHPDGGGIEPARSLLAKGYLEPASEGAGFRLTDRAKALLALKPAPAGSEGEAEGSEA